MRSIRTLPPLAIFALGLILLFAAAQLGRAWEPAWAAPAEHGQSLDHQSPGQKADTQKAGQESDKGSSSAEGGKKPSTEGGKTKGGAAGNGASGSGKAEGILVAEVLLLLMVGRVLGEGMQRIGQPALMGTLLAGIILGPSLFGWLWPPAQHFLFPQGRGPERHDRRPVADGHPDAAAADRHGDRPQAGEKIRRRCHRHRALRHRLSLRLRFSAGPVRAGRAVPGLPAAGWCPRCSWAPRFPSPPSRSWPWWCGR